MISKVSLLFLTFSILNSCGSLNIHDTKVCTTAGVVEAGANCTYAVTGVQTQLNFAEFIDMLEPSETHGPAVVIPLKDFVDLKNELEQACVYLKCKKASDKSHKKKLNNIIENINKFIKQNENTNNN